MVLIAAYCTMLQTSVHSSSVTVYQSGQYWNQIDYILCSQWWRSYIQSAKIRPEADYGSDHEFLITKFRLKLKKVGKTARPFKYDLNQITYDYTEEVTNRFKELDLIDRVPEDLWMEVCNTVQETPTKTISEKNCSSRWKKLFMFDSCWCWVIDTLDWSFLPSQFVTLIVI